MAGGSPMPAPRSMRNVWVSLILSTAGLLGGCATLSEEECRQGNWAQVGQRDGQRGSALSKFNEHAEACGKLGIRPDADQYFAGRNAGIRFFCTARNGWERGSRNATEDASVCPVALAGGYLDGYRLGRRVYEARVPVERLDRQRRTLQERLREAKTDNDRAALREELARNDRALASARRTLRDIEDVTSRTLRSVEDAQLR